MKLELTQTVDVDEEIAQKLSATLSTYRDLKMQLDLLDEAVKAEAKKIQAEMELLGVDKMDIDGTPCTIVRGKSSKLDKALFVQLGGSLKILEEATRSKPKKAFLRIGAEKSQDDD